MTKEVRNPNYRNRPHAAATICVGARPSGRFTVRDFLRPGFSVTSRVCATRKRRKRRAPAARASTTLNRYPSGERAGVGLSPTGSWEASRTLLACIWTLNRWLSPSPVLRTPSPPVGERERVRGCLGSWKAIANLRWLSTKRATGLHHRIIRNSCFVVASGFDIFHSSFTARDSSFYPAR